jgi:nucleotide-binding universal stress UspA family protein
MKVLIGYDGSEGAHAAIHDLLRAGLPRDVEALVVSVADVLPPFPHSSYEPKEEQVSMELEPPMLRKARALAAEAMAQARILAAQGAQRVQAEFPDWKVSHEACANSPYWALISKADRWKPDLVVVGSQGRSAVGRFFLGSVSQNVLAHVSCSVRIGRGAHVAPPPAGAPVRIIIGVDGSANAAASVSAVAGRMWPPGSEVKVIAAVDFPFWTELLLGFGLKDRIAQEEDNGLSFARPAVEAAVEGLRIKNLSPTPIVVEGDPKRVLLEEAERWGADCIFLGAKGHSHLERFLLGSVSAAVAARAHCSVEVVRHA